MRVFFEGASYEKSDVLNIDPSLYYHTNEGEKFSHIGYTLPEGESEPIVVLPKVLLDSKGKFMGLTPSVFCDINKGLEEIRKEKERNPDYEFKSVDEKSIKDAICGMSTWIYRSIAHYVDRIGSTKIIAEGHIQNVISKKEDGTSVTYLDVILQLFQFAKDHKNLFVFITNVNRQGNKKIAWDKTIRKVAPVMQDGDPYYLKFYAKKKEIDFDEDLLTLFFSVLKYLRHSYSFEYDSVFNYDTYTPNEIENMIAAGRGTRKLRSIRYKYFTDELVTLWNLLFVFFDKSERIKSNKSYSEKLMVHDYNEVFEDMIDQLISDDVSFQKDKNTERKKQKDGKEIDHLYKDFDLPNSDSYIYYIADSKYYPEGGELGEESVYKQYTYAKNVIQHNIDLFNKGELDDTFRYRDSLTEGYNITPNFYIRGTVKQTELNNTSFDELKKPEKDRKDEKWTGFRKNIHFKNRLFDRDTLPTQEYYVNFMFVLASYVSNSQNSSFKEIARNTFKKDLTSVLNERYNFYSLQVGNGYDLETEVDSWFRKLNGKIYRLSEDDNYIVLALEKYYMADSLSLLWDLRFNSNFKKINKFLLGEKIVTKDNVDIDEIKRSKQYEPDSEIYFEQSAAEHEFSYKRKGKSVVLFGCYNKDWDHKNWITTKKFYNVRYDVDRDGAVNDKAEIAINASKLVLYSVEDPKEFEVYAIVDAKVANNITQVYNYKEVSPSNNYLLYTLDGPLVGKDLNKYLVQDVFDFVDNHKQGAPIYVEFE